MIARLANSRTRRWGTQAPLIAVLAVALGFAGGRVLSGGGHAARTLDELVQPVAHAGLSAVLVFSYASCASDYGSVSTLLSWAKARTRAVSGLGVHAPVDHTVRLLLEGELGITAPVKEADWDEVRTIAAHESLSVPFVAIVRNGKVVETGGRVGGTVKTRRTMQEPS